MVETDESLTHIVIESHAPGFRSLCNQSTAKLCVTFCQTSQSLLKSSHKAQQSFTCYGVAVLVAGKLTDCSSLIGGSNPAAYLLTNYAPNSHTCDY